MWRGGRLCFVLAYLLLAACAEATADRRLTGRGVDLPVDVPAASSKLPWRPYASNKLGVTHCSLLGVLNSEPVTLHVWVRMIHPSARVGHKGRNATVKGFAFLQSNRKQGGASPYYLQSRNLMYFPSLMYIRSKYNRLRYGLNVSMPIQTAYGLMPQAAAPKSQGTKPNTTLSSIQTGTETRTKTASVKTLGRTLHGTKDSTRTTQQGLKSVSAAGLASGVGITNGSARVLPPGPATSHVIQFYREFQLNSKDVDIFEFEFRVIGFDWHCLLVLEPPVLPIHKPQLGWRHHDHVTNTTATQGTYLLPYTHAMDSRHFSHVLWHHMAWHEPLGIRTYVVYATGRVGRLMAEPLVRALVAAGRLFVVALKDLPAYESTRYKPALRDLSGPQAILYNHMLLALWGADTLAVVGSVHEFLLTYKPLSLKQVFGSCVLPSQTDQTSAAGLLSVQRSSEVKGPVAGMQVLRLAAACNASDPVCKASKSCIDLFVNKASPADVRSGRARHPLSQFTFGRTTQTAVPFTSKQSHETRAIVDPGRVQGMHIHFATPLKTSRMVWGQMACVRILQLPHLLHKSAWLPSKAAGSVSDRGWWWQA